MRVPQVFLALLLAAPSYTVRMLPLPPAATGGIYMDYLAYDPSTGFVWAPAGNTGAVDVVDTATGKITKIPDFPTAVVQVRNGKRTFGPTSATVGKGVVYIGNRADYNVCAVDARSLKKGACGHIDSMPDGLSYVAMTKEVWVTAPRDKSIRILDADSLHEKSKLTYPGNPEGFAVDNKHGRFYTNLEDKDQTLAINAQTHATVATWNPNCGSEGPHGLRFDEKSGFLFVACSARAEVMDTAHDGKVLSSIDTGGGVDDIDYVPASHMLFVGAAKAAQLTVASVDANGKLTVIATVPTEKGARNPAVATNGKVFLAHGGGAPLNDLAVAVPAK